MVEEGSDSYLTLPASWRSRQGQELVEGDLSVSTGTRNPCWGFMQPLGVLELEPARVGNSLGGCSTRHRQGQGWACFSTGPRGGV